MSNDILNQGCVTPFIIVNFAAGSIDQIPPKYFISFQNVRSCSKACRFELQIKYVADTFRLGTPEIINQMLLASVNQDVKWQYGYYTSTGQIRVQNVQYCGFFTTYTENIDSNGSLTYLIKGIGSEFSMLTEEVTLPEYHIGGSASSFGGLQPSNYLSIQVNYKLQKYFNDYNVDIAKVDKYVKHIPAYTGPLLDGICGSTNSDKIKQGGLVSLSVISKDRYLNSGVVSSQDSYYYSNFKYIGASYSNTPSSMKTDAQNAYNKVSSLLEDGFIAYFDSISTNGKKGTFYYRPKNYGSPGSQYVYQLGNNIKDSDVLDFSVDYDGSVAMASVASTNVIDSNIDINGNNIGSTNIITSAAGFNRNTYTTLSGFNEEVFMSRSLLSDKLVYPFKATLRVLGQLNVSYLCDEINVTILINGTEHPAFSGKYSVIGIVDELSDSGFTTTLELVRIATPEQTSAYSTWVSNNETSRAQEVQTNINNSKNLK